MRALAADNRDLRVVDLLETQHVATHGLVPPEAHLASPIAYPPVAWTPGDPACGVPLSTRVGALRQAPYPAIAWYWVLVGKSAFGPIPGRGCDK